MLTVDDRRSAAVKTGNLERRLKRLEEAATGGGIQGSEISRGTSKLIAVSAAVEEASLAFRPSFRRIVLCDCALLPGIGAE